MTDELPASPYRRDFDTARDPYTARNALGITTWVASINGQSGAITIAAGTGIGVATTTGTITISVTGSYQPLDADLTAIAALTGTNTIYYRSAADTWSPVTIGTGLAFATGTLSSTVTGATGPPQGRLSLSTGVAVPTSNVTAATTIYYTPYLGQLVPLYDGTNFSMTDIGGELSQATTDTTKSPAAVAANSNYDFFAWDDSGTKRCTRGPAWSSGTSRGTGAGTTELVRVKGFLLNAQSITNGPAAQRGTYVGTVRSNGSSQIDWRFAGTGSGGVALSLHVWNCYNRVVVTAANIDNGANYSYTTATIRQARASSGNQINFVIGLLEDGIIATHSVEFRSAVNGTGEVGFGLDGTTSFAVGGGHMINYGGGSITVGTSGTLTYPIDLTSITIGSHFIAALERGDGSLSTTFDVNSVDALGLIGRF